MKFNKIVFFSICLLLTSCHRFLCNQAESQYKEIFDFGREVQKEYNLRVVGFGGGNGDGFRTFNITLMGSYNSDLERARYIFYKLINKFLDQVNSNEMLKNEAGVDFFTIANIDLDIMLPRESDLITGVGIAYARYRNPNQYVCFFTYNKETGKTEITYEEPYAELCSIVESQIQNGMFD